MYPAGDIISHQPVTYLMKKYIAPSQLHKERKQSQSIAMLLYLLGFPFQIPHGLGENGFCLVSNHTGRSFFEAV